MPIRTCPGGRRPDSQPTLQFAVQIVNQNQNNQAQLEVMALKNYKFERNLNTVLLVPPFSGLNFQLMNFP